jgi:aconitate hydratase
MTSRVDKAREIVGHPPLTEKILYNHLWDGMPSKVLREELIMLIFSRQGCLSRCNCSNGFVAIYARRKSSGSCPTTVHCDHLIQAKVDAVTDL